jgi:hypothetical protein
MKQEIGMASWRAMSCSPEPARNSFRSNRGLDLPPMERKEQSSGRPNGKFFCCDAFFA